MLPGYELQVNDEANPEYIMEVRLDHECFIYLFRPTKRYSKDKTTESAALL